MSSIVVTKLSTFVINTSVAYVKAIVNLNKYMTLLI